MGGKEGVAVAGGNEGKLIDQFRGQFGGHHDAGAVRRDQNGDHAHDRGGRPEHGLAGPGVG